MRLAKPGSAVNVSCVESPDAITIAITSRGQTVPEPVIPRFFDLLAVAEAITRDGEFGLGPAVASRILSLFDASVAIRNCEGGVQLTVSFTRGRPER